LVIKKHIIFYQFIYLTFLMLDFFAGRYLGLGRTAIHYVYKLQIQILNTLLITMRYESWLGVVVNISP
jgi:hypothetical protein